MGGETVVVVRALPSKCSICLCVFWGVGRERALPFMGV